MFASLANAAAELGQEARLDDMTDSQRALELRKFFAPFDERVDSISGHGVNQSIIYDGALDAYAELILWRLHGVRAMVTLVDKTTQYFVAGVVRQDNTVDEIITEHNWFTCSTVETPGGLCENVLAVNRELDEYPCFQVPDLSADPRFSHQSVVDGSIASYRFYAGTPITTSHGINIGSFFIFDDKPRPGGLSLKQRKCLFETAANVMKHLESKREAVERRRISLMSTGVAKFLEWTARLTELDVDSNSEGGLSSAAGSGAQSSCPDVTVTTSASDTGRDEWQEKRDAPEIVLDSIKVTLDRAAQILRESLELTSGGVIFLDTAIGPAEPRDDDDYFGLDIDPDVTTARTGGNAVVPPYASPNLEPDLTMTGIIPDIAMSAGAVRGSRDEYRPARTPALSCSKNAYERSKVLDGKTLQKFIDVYPKGNVWYIDAKGYFFSLDQMDDIYRDPAKASIWEGRGSVEYTVVDVARQRAEAALLSEVFQDARQIIFLPLWDARSNRWHSGCFVWNNHAFPVFTVDSELSYVAALCNSVMVEISRLDSITANNMKSDFISSISHEFRSPLHGILASAEFLHDSTMDTSQNELVSTIQTCGSTLLDTINHVLDYSKINSFEKKTAAGTLSNELQHTANVALLCEDIVSGIMAARDFGGMGDSNDDGSQDYTQQHGSFSLNPHDHPVEIILDFEDRDWEFKINPGALRRIIMNLFGNAQKYTETGFILIQLRVKGADGRQTSPTLKKGQKMLALNIVDSGRGMSQQYMERKLYAPFAQEDSFAPGIGLGLSIVRSIVNQLQGRINIRSELTKGTDVEVLLPFPDPIEHNSVTTTAPSASNSDLGAVKVIQDLRELAQGKTVAIYRAATLDRSGSKIKDLAWKTVTAYCKTWFGFTILRDPNADALVRADLVITERQDTPGALTTFGPAARVLHLQHATATSRAAKRFSRIETIREETISMPVGPFKLARSILSLFLEPDALLCYSEEDEAERNSSDDATAGSSGPPQTDTPQSDVSPAAEQEPGIPDYVAAAHVAPLMDLLPMRPNSALSMHPAMRPMAHTQTSLPPLPTFASLSITSDARPLHILAVDDNALNLLLLTRYLGRRKGDRVVTARNGAEAVEAVRAEKERGGGFDVVFMDISMPVMDGFEATRWIRGIERWGWLGRSGGGQLKEEDELGEWDGGGAGREGTGEGGKRMKRSYVVALTGLASRRDRDEAVRSGFDDFLTKPVSFGMIGKLLGRLSREGEWVDGSA